MTKELSYPNLLPDLSKLTLRRAFTTDQGWVRPTARTPPLVRIAKRFPARARVTTGAAWLNSNKGTKSDAGIWPTRSALRHYFPPSTSLSCAGPYPFQVISASRINNATKRAFQTGGYAAFFTRFVS